MRVSGEHVQIAAARRPDMRVGAHVPREGMSRLGDSGGSSRRRSRLTDLLISSPPIISSFPRGTLGPTLTSLLFPSLFYSSFLPFKQSRRFSPPLPFNKLTTINSTPSLSLSLSLSPSFPMGDSSASYIHLVSKTLLLLCSLSSSYLFLCLVCDFCCFYLLDDHSLSLLLLWAVF